MMSMATATHTIMFEKSTQNLPRIQGPILEEKKDQVVGDDDDNDNNTIIRKFHICWRSFFVSSSGNENISGMKLGILIHNNIIRI